jgi:hypothetical protein
VGRNFGGAIVEHVVAQHVNFKFIFFFMIHLYFVWFAVSKKIALVKIKKKESWLIAKNRKNKKKSNKKYWSSFN